ncbi:hypothetical protein [Rhizobium ruizarguesonis]|uniref:hypothetical protein n=1 Tax=Rhizobium ruizarguesonis TaxID=2081791 RepID=UPI00102FC29A|nr:hypothetical protein [Rhizobium ruizarguesonis]TBA18769.1 hypothetical protein ELH65_23930 [Rhizobium ruizarguesonis]
MLLIIGLVGVIFGGACAIVASNKSRDVLGWFVLGFLLNLIALIVIAALTPLDKAPAAEGADDKRRSDEEVLEKDELRKKAAALAASLAQSREKLSG